MLLAFVGLLPMVATARPAAPSQAAATVDQAVTDGVAANGSADFWVVFREKADLSAAYGLSSKAARGQYTYDQLTSTASRTQAGLAAELDAQGVRYRAFWAVNAIRVFGGDQAALDAAKANAEVAEIRATHTYALPDPVAEPDGGQINVVEWGVANIRADQVWSDFGVRGEGIVVANIDTGAQFDHPALVDNYRGNLGGGSFDHNYNWHDPSEVCASPSLVPCDNNGHGTHTMGTMTGDDRAANQIGVAPRTEWIAAKGCETTGCSDFALISSGEWMLAPTDLTGANPDPSRAPHVVNNSWGAANGSAIDPFYRQIVIDWTAAGIFGVFSNGNSGPGCDTTGSPADNLEAWGVGAYDINNSIADFSSRGPGENGEIRPNLAAPGVNVRSSVPGNGYSAFSGTSMAAPHQSGAVALMWSAAPALIGDITQTRDILDTTAVDTEDLQCGGTADDNNVFGEGRLDAFAAVEQSPRGPVGSLTGTVTDASTGEPIAGATVSLEVDGNPRSTFTGADGTYAFSALPVGTYDVTATAFGYGSDTQSAEITEGATTTLDFTLDPAAAGSVSGTVTDPAGNGVAGATVTIEGTPLTTTTDADGNYAFASVPQGDYTLTVSAGGCFADTSVDITVAGDEVVDVELGRVTDAFGHTCRNQATRWVRANTPLALTGDDASIAVDLPFAFSFYGTEYTQAHVATNGFLNFLAPNTTYTNTAIPDPAAPNAAIYVEWDDLFVDAEAGVFTAVKGPEGNRRFVIEWRNIRPFSATERWDFEVILHEDGRRILMQYRNVDGDRDAGSSATVGIENADGTDALQFSFNQAVLSNDQGIRFLAPRGGPMSGAAALHRS
ncbi:MAG: S8 family serine peptidase [Acidimicrobiales bacterium]